MASDPGASSPAPSPAAAPTDSASPFKRERRRTRVDEPKVSMFQLRDLWLMLFLAEAVLMLGAMWLTFGLYRMTQYPEQGFPLLSVVVIALLYVGLAAYARIQELILPRKVVFVGVGLLLLLSAGVSAAIFADALLMGGSRRLTNAALVLTPVHLFMLRCLLVFREARFTPSASALLPRLRSKSDTMKALRRKLRFWLS